LLESLLATKQITLLISFGNEPCIRLAASNRDLGGTWLATHSRHAQSASNHAAARHHLRDHHPHLARPAAAETLGRYPVLLHLVVVASNHIHLIATAASVKQLADFMCYVNSNIAREGGH
jgi:hypothetical protein